MHVYLNYPDVYRWLLTASRATDLMFLRRDKLCDADCGLQRSGETTGPRCYRSNCLLLFLQQSHEPTGRVRSTEGPALVQNEAPFDALKVSSLKAWLYLTGHQLLTKWCYRKKESCWNYQLYSSPDKHTVVWLCLKSAKLLWEAQSVQASCTSVDV